MSEYKTLKEWFGEATRGDGRKFSIIHWNSYAYFEPIFLANGVWFGIDEAGYAVEWSEESINPFKEWHPPKKKVTKYLWYDNYNKFFFHEFASSVEDLGIVRSKKGLYTLPSDTQLTRLDWSATEFDDA